MGFNKLFISSVLVLLFLLQCTTPGSMPTIGNAADGKYDSEFPRQPISAELDRIASSVKMLNCVAFYMTYFFRPGNDLSRENCTMRNLDSLSVKAMVTNESVAGTATIVYYEPELIGLITCAHIVDFADTITTSYGNEFGGLRSLSVKIKQQNYVTGIPDGSPVEVVAIDLKRDIAFLKKTLNPHIEPMAVLNYPRGHARELDWGCLTYVVGFPSGNLMVTQGIVSNPEKIKTGFFTTDASYNQGISGSPVFALRDGVSNMEWVGMASSASATSEYRLKPNLMEAEKMVLGEQFTGEILIDKKKSINYGISYSVAMEEILTFIEINKKKVSAAGFEVDLLFHSQKPITNTISH